ncbi:TonB-dependent receptor [Sphingomonas oligophenolica]|uniref:TonB-dependent receptor n=1 Tax=Sphingomonas oligophenolica TaxID=301154 RepID=A0ABU9Y7B6_9SPHN
MKSIYDSGREWRRPEGRWLGVSTAALAMALLASPAWAQATHTATSDSSAGAGPMQPSGAVQSDRGDAASADVVVTGIRKSVESAVAIKRNADQIVDSISAQDIGALPDRSVAETLQRISGVSLTRTASELTTGRPTDPGRIAPEGGGVTIRGLTGVGSTSNGRDIFTAGSRTLDWADVSSDLIAGIDVYKNPSAEMIEGALSGIIDLRSRKPFDQSGRLVSFSADVSYGDLMKRGFVSGNGLYSNRWTTPGGAEIGFLVSATVNNKGTRTNTIQSGILGAQTLASAIGSRPAGSTVYTPSGLGLSSIDWQQHRFMIDGVLQFRPIPDMQFTLDMAYSKATPHELEYAAFTGSPPLDSNSVFDANNALIGGVVPRENLDLDTRHGDYHYQTRDFSLNWRYAPSGTPWTFTADLQRVTSTADVLSFTVFDEFGIAPNSTNRPTLNFNFGNDPHITTTPAPGFPYTDKGSYWWAAAMDHLEHNTAAEWASRADVEYKFEDSFLKSLRVGARWTNKDFFTNQTTYNWSLLSAEFWGGGTPVYLNQDVVPNLSGQTTFFGFPNFMHGSQPAPLSGWFPSPSLVNDTQLAYKYLAATETAGWGWAPLTYANYPNNVADQKETTKAAYAVVRFGESEGPLGRFEGNIGVRVINTIYHGTGFASVGGIQATLTGCQTANAANPSKCDALANALKFLGASPTTPAQGGITGPFRNSYTDVLPSLNLNFHLNDRLQLRFAVAKAMLRPDFHQTSPVSNYSFTFDSTGATQPGVNPYGGNIGNPNLKPMTAWQGDTSIEYYWGHGNSVTLALFYKDIANQIETKAYDINLTANGVTLPFHAFTNDNSSKHAKIKGLEVGFTQFLDFLHGPLAGFGAQGNFTYLDATGGINSAYSATAGGAAGVSSANLPYEQLSKYAFNAALIYSKYGVDARVAYNWRSKYLMTIISANNFAPTWAEDFGQLDGSIFVDITKNIKIGIQGTNILGTRTYLDRSLLTATGGVVPLQSRYQVTDKDRVIDAAIRVRF